MPIAPMLGIRDDSVTNTVVPVGENTPDSVVGVRRDKKRHPDYDHTRVPRVL